MDTTFLSSSNLRTAGIIVLGALALFLLTSAVTEVKGWKFIGSGTTATNTISVTGKGEVFAVPDIATFSLTVSETAKDVKAAQKTATEKTNDIVAYLRGDGKIAEKDIKTTNYSVQPKYEWIQPVCVAGRPCNGENKLVGYTVEQTIEVKVRDTDNAGEILAAAGSKGVSQVSGLEFKVDDEDALKVEARQKAIQEAKEKADALARDLGVTIVRVVGFSEDGYQPPMPMYARAESKVMNMAMDMAAAPEMPVGENKVQSNVTVTYEIR